MASTAKCTGWKVTKAAFNKSLQIHDNTCRTSRMKKECRIAPARLSGIHDADTWTVNCTTAKWNSQRGRWDLQAKGKDTTAKGIFAARKIANRYLKWK